MMLNMLPSNTSPLTVVASINLVLSATITFINGIIYVTLQPYPWEGIISKIRKGSCSDYDIPLKLELAREFRQWNAVSFLCERGNKIKFVCLYMYSQKCLCVFFVITYVYVSLCLCVCLHVLVCVNKFVVCACVYLTMCMCVSSFSFCMCCVCVCFVCIL